MCCSLKAQMACTNPSNSIKNYDQQYTFGNKINKLLFFFLIMNTFLSFLLS